MSVQTFYRLAVWLPLAVPGVVALVVHGVGVPLGLSPLDKIAQLLLASLLYGGIPYAVIAVWAIFWIDGRPEQQIRRRALQSPLWMIAAYASIPLLIGARSGNAPMALAVFGLGAVAILVLGYAYVMTVFSLRKAVFGSFPSDP